MQGPYALAIGERARVDRGLRQLAVADSIRRMASGPQRPTVLIGLGIAFVLGGLLGFPLFLADPLGTTGRGIPMWLALPVLWVGGIGFIAYGWYWRVRGRRSR